MSSLPTIIADLLPYMFAAVGLEILSGRIRKLNQRVAELEGEVARLKPSEPRLHESPSRYYDALKRQAERTQRFLNEREQKQRADKTND